MSAVRSNQTLRFIDEWQCVQTDPASLVDELASDDWQPLSAGEASKGPRLYDWARVPLNWQTKDGFAHWLLVRRSRHDREAIASYFAYAPANTSLAELAAAAGLALDDRGMLPAGQG